jgi:uncharacterized glyoxalase superfamily protein PhnB
MYIAMNRFKVNKDRTRNFEAWTKSNVFQKAHSHASRASEPATMGVPQCEGFGRIILMQVKQVVPILRIFDFAKAHEFYLDYLGFQLDWEHRFATNMPLYLQVSKGMCVLHLSEHYGDCSPGAAVRIEVVDLDSWYQVLAGKNYAYLKPSIEVMPWQSRELSLTDPFGNRLTFHESIS